MSQLRIATVAALLLTGALFAAPAAAQEKTYTPNELSTLPKLSDPGAAARAVTRAYPAHLKSAGVTGMVQLEMVVNPDGSVDKGSIEIVQAQPAAFRSPAASVAQQLRFSPGEADGKPVRSKVLLPLIFK